MRSFVNAVATVAASLLVTAALADGTMPDAAAQRSTLDRVRDAGELRVCLTGDYKPFGFLRPDGQFEGIDVDLAQSLAASLKVKARFVKTTWSTLMDDFTGGACDIAMGGISISLERELRAAFTTPIMVDGKAPIARCTDVDK